MRQILRGYNVHSIGEPQLLQYFKTVFLEIQNVTPWWIFVNPVTYNYKLLIFQYENDTLVITGVQGEAKDKN